VRTKKNICAICRINEERVLHIPSWMIFGEVQLSEVVIIILNIGSLGNLKAH
jgi:hypothetical protein